MHKRFIKYVKHNYTKTWNVLEEKIRYYILHHFGKITFFKMTSFIGTIAHEGL